MIRRIPVNYKLIDIFKGEWEDVTRKHKRKESGNKKGSRTKDTNNEQAIAITQNNFNELMEETEIQIGDVSKHEQTPRKGEKCFDMEKGESQDEWTEISSSSSEEEDSSENTSVEEDEEDDQEEEEPNIEKNTSKPSTQMDKVQNSS
ncbi:hypothetical protein K7X08_006689 [Anisodus acutangulus]|uniref:Uncharacterized protein n=1 Tax=Anisodus acutangulus TaxID=402998 RepID=A0A9Q1MWA1_9SOLA|nr:hypothetical protein K7X08_006689 [Anisodus acutangulus]